VLVANDYAVVAAGVAAMLAPYRQRVDVVGVGWRGGPPPEVDVVLYDTFGALALDEAEVVEAFRESPARLVVYGWPHESRRVEDALTHGAVGYLSKELAPEQLVAALELVRDGETVVSGPVGASRLPEAGTWPGAEHSLSAREAEVVALIVRGLSNQQIAEQTYLSVNSIKTYIRTAYKKMRVANRAQAVIWGVRHGFGTDSWPG
jgi:two-component system, NarL family, response regulator LiaR